jgi:hypothetical protein
VPNPHEKLHFFEMGIKPQLLHRDDAHGLHEKLHEYQKNLAGMVLTERQLSYQTS